MRSHWIALAGFALCATLIFAQEKDEKKPEAKPETKIEEKIEAKSEFKTLAEKAVYTIGHNIGKNFKNQSMEVDLNILLRGIKDGMSGSKPLLTDAEMREAMTSFQKEMAEKRAERAKVQGEKNKKEGEAFLAENKGKPGVQILPSGLQYKILQAGTGPIPKATDQVTTQYRGTLIDGTEFDSSYRRGQPATFRVTGVIKGWTEALQLMPVGSKWQLFIPSELAYGERGTGADIGPNATLIFEIELLAISEPSKVPAKK